MGPTALNYQAVESALRLMAIPRKRWSELFEDIQALEAGALSEIYAASRKSK